MASIGRHAAISSLAQVTLKLTAPGVPDIYQGCELWDFSLVDPDNRRPPDWALRQAMMGGERHEDEKLFVTRRLLDLRKRHPAVFAHGDYTPLSVEGGRADDHLCAFMRSHEDEAVAVAVPRLVHRLYHGGEAADWDNTGLALPGDWEDVLSGARYADGQRVRAADLFAALPVAVLLRR